MIGSILFNGNVVREQDFITQFKERILRSNHIDPRVQKTKKVVLITAAWGENEFNEQHVKNALSQIGIQPNYNSGFDENIQNLSIYHAWLEYYQQNPSACNTYNEAIDTLLNVKKFYQERNTELVHLLQRHSIRLKQEFPHLSLERILDKEYNNLTSAQNTQELFQNYACHEIQKTLDYLIGGDELQAKISENIQEYAKGRSGVFSDRSYQQKRQLLVERILSANSIFIFGGDIATLYHSLRFWELQDALKEALLRGTNFYTVSAGSMVLGQKIIVYDDFEQHKGQQKRHFEFFDNGFGLVKKITLFPHCKDRIQTDDPNNLAYLAHRFGGRTCVGLNEESYLLLDSHTANNRLYPRYTSVGKKDGVHVFDPSGEKICLKYGEELAVPGTFAWEKQKKTSNKKLSKYQGETLWGND